MALTPLKLTFFDECHKIARKRWLLKGFLARGETSSLIGPPGSGKSALQTEIAVHCAAGRDWRSHRSPEACGVLILALERADLYRRRLSAYRRRDGLSGLPIAVAGSVIDFLDPQCVDLIVAAVHEAERAFGLGVGLIVVDTFSKGIAANGGDEDKARDQNRAAVNLAQVHERLSEGQRPGVHIALVGHTGKKEDRGARGSNAHLGDVDVMVQISGNAFKTAAIIKANDQAERVVAKFKLDPVEIGRDDDGEAIKTAIVSIEHPADQRTAAGGAPKNSLPEKPTAALRALQECVAEQEAPRPDDPHIPSNAKGVTLATWRKRLGEKGIINIKGNHREQFKRIHVTLESAGAIGTWDGFAWPVT